VLVPRIDTLRDRRECTIANSHIDLSSTKVRNTRHPRGACENAAWRLHYFWGEKCSFLLEDSSPRATRARLVKILRTAYKLDQKPSSCLPCTFILFFISVSASSYFLPSSLSFTILYLQSFRLFRKSFRNQRHSLLYDACDKFVLIQRFHNGEKNKMEQKIYMR